MPPKSPNASPMEPVQAFLESAYGPDHLPTLSALCTFLGGFPRATRWQRCRDALSLTPGDSWNDEMVVGRVRALLTEGLENILGGPIPLDDLRELFSTYSPVRFSAWMTKLTFASEFEVHTVLAALALRLSRADRGGSIQSDRTGNHERGVTTQHIASAWPTLPPHVREAIVTLVDAAKQDNRDSAASGGSRCHDAERQADSSRD